MNEPTIYVTECNALGRAIPRLLREMHSKDPGSPEWEEAYHVYYAAEDRRYNHRRRINAEVEPWFNESAFCPR
jgi:hypothetical protein